jgi:hypothetical protein
MQNNQLLTKSRAELEDNSYIAYLKTGEIVGKSSS